MHIAKAGVLKCNTMQAPEQPAENAWSGGVALCGQRDSLGESKRMDWGGNVPDIERRLKPPWFGYIRNDGILHLLA